MNKVELLSGAWVPVIKRLPRTDKDRKIIAWDFIRKVPVVVDVKVYETQQYQIVNSIISEEKLAKMAKQPQMAPYFTSHWIELPPPTFDEATSKWVDNRIRKYQV